jgi:ribosome biogenesis protein BRX1
MEDIEGLLPHAKKEAKIDKKEVRENVEDLCIQHTCSNLMLFEAKRRTDLFLWLAKSDGLSVKFQVQNISTSLELKMTGNNLKYSRPLLSFDAAFLAQTEKNVHIALFKELIVQSFGTPRFHPKSKPFIDHIFSFKWHDG